MILTIDHQIEHMSSEWPEWQVTKSSDRQAVWTGTLQPHRRQYSVSIDYTVPLVIQRASSLWIQPLVSIAQLTIWREPNLKLPPLPHVYWRHPRTPLLGPFLCLFDAESKQWSSESSIALTTVPWTALWLSFFEGWLVTGHWCGGGVHEIENWK